MPFERQDRSVGEMRRGFASLYSHKCDESLPATGGNSCRDWANLVALRTRRRIDQRFRQDDALRTPHFAVQPLPLCRR